MNKNLQTAFNSRQYMLAKDFEIYYYSDTNIKNVKLHSHDYYEFYFFIKGYVAININGNEQYLKPGDIILIPPKTKHRLTVKNQTVPYQRFIFWVSKKFCNELSKLSPDFGYLFQPAAVLHKYIYNFDVLSFNTIQTKIISLLEELHTGGFAHDTMVSVRVSDLIITLSRMIYEAEKSPEIKEDVSLYQSILSYIESHIYDDISLQTIADTLYVSKYHIAHLFKKRMGLSIHQYILKKRLSLCKASIAAGNEITAAFSECGFGDYSSFYRAFKKEFGLSPKEFKSSSDKIRSF